MSILSPYDGTDFAMAEQRYKKQDALIRELVEALKTCDTERCNDQVQYDADMVNQALESAKKMGY